MSKTYYISLRQTGKQYIEVPNCKSKAEAMRKVREFHPDCDFYDFEIVHSLWSTMEVTGIAEEKQE